MGRQRFELPPYPHDRLAPIVEASRRRFGDPIDLSIGTPCDPPPDFVMRELDDPDKAKGYPPSGGFPALRQAVADWFESRLAVSLQPDQVGVCVGTKEFVAGIPHWLRLRDPTRDTVLYPQISYPTYAMGADLAGCRAVPVPLSESGELVLDAVSDDDISRALCIWSNSPSNPTGLLDDLEAVAAWGRRHGVPVFSDECYLEFTWGDIAGTVDTKDGGGSSDRPPTSGRPPAATILSGGVEGVVAVNSLSKRSNLAGLRAGFYAGDPELVDYLGQVRKHAGLMIPGPVQAAATAALADQQHVEAQRDIYIERMRFLVRILRDYGLPAELPRGGFYLWIDSSGEGGWELTERIARDLGVIVSPGEFYGPTVVDHIRVAAVQPMEVLAVMSDRV